MRVLFVTAFDDNLADYGERMIRSLRHFHPDADITFCDYGDCSGLDKMGVRVLTPDPLDPLPRKPARFRDVMLWPFVKTLEWDRLVWLDADTLVLRPLDELWSYDVDFVGHPDRDDTGLVLTCHYDTARWCCVPGARMAKFATGVWCARSRALLYETWLRVVNGRHCGRDSDVMTYCVREGHHNYHQLDGNAWNFSRQLIPLAQLDERGIYYEMDGVRHEPRTAGFSRVPVNGVDIRLGNEAIDKFYDKVICENK